MNILQPYAEVWEQKYGTNANELYVNMQKQIELAGRTCYKSDDKINDESYIKFVGMLEKNKHTAMFEHGTLYLTIKNNSMYYDIGMSETNKEFFEKLQIVNFFKNNKYSKVVEKTEDNFNKIYYITTNFRVVVENNIKLNGNRGFVELQNVIMPFITAPTQFHEKRITVHFATDIGVTREANRHRVDSVAEQSTRYCNFSKGKFGGEISINQPTWINDEMLKTSNKDFIALLNKVTTEINDDIDDCGLTAIDTWLFANYVAEWSYLRLIKLGWKPQQARTILPLDTHSELIHTAFVSDWKHFIDLRSNGTTGAPHPDMKKVADMLKDEFIELKYYDR